MADLMQIRRRILIAADPDLPPGYKRVDYIRTGADNFAYIDTAYVPVQYDEIEAEYMDTAKTAGTRAIFSAGTGTYQLVLLETTGDANTYFRYFDTTAPAKNFRLSQNTWYTLTLSSQGKLSIGNESKTYSYVSAIDGDNKTLRIFRRKNDASQFFGKLRSFRITNNGTLKLNLIPCIRAEDGKAGAYDTVSKAFFGSASKDEFIPSTLDS